MTVHNANPADVERAVRSVVKGHTGKDPVINVSQTQTADNRLAGLTQIRR